MAMDIAPTFLSFAGLGNSLQVDGKDQSAMLLQGGKSAHDHVHWLYLDSRAVRRGDWKLIENPPRFPNDPQGQPGDRLWLSNLASDPGEKRNLASSEPGRVRELQSLLPAYVKTAG
jgi:arylsulfatase A-like enzyme